MIYFLTFMKIFQNIWILKLNLNPLLTLYLLETLWKIQYLFRSMCYCFESKRVFNCDIIHISLPWCCLKAKSWKTAHTSGLNQSYIQSTYYPFIHSMNSYWDLLCFRCCPRPWACLKKPNRLSTHPLWIYFSITRKHILALCSHQLSNMITTYHM